MKKKMKKVLTLSRETIRELEIQQARQVVAASAVCTGTPVSGITCCP